MDFRTSGLPQNRTIEKAFEFACRQSMKQAWSELRDRTENDAAVAVDTAKILLATVDNANHDFIAGHIAGWALPVRRDFYGQPQRADIKDLVRQGLSAPAAQIARYIQDFRFDNPAFPQCDVRISPSAGIHQRISCLAGATFHLECLMKKYGGLRAGETAQFQRANGVTVRKAPLDILRDELDRCAFRDNIAFLGTTGQPKLEARYKNALLAVEKRMEALKPPPPPQKTPPAPAFNKNARPQTPEEALAALEKILRDSYYKGPYNTYMGALRARMSVRRQMRK